MTDEPRIRIECRRCKKVNAILESGLARAVQEGSLACAACGASLPLPARVNRLPISTTDTIPGTAVQSFVSFVSATATLDASVGERKRSEDELRAQLVATVIEKISDAASLMGATAITGLALVWTSGNVGGGTIGAAAGRGDVVGLIATGNAVVTNDA